MDDETIRLVLQIRGQTEVGELTKECHALGAAFVADTNAINTFDTAAKRTQGTIRSTTKEAKAADDALDRLDKTVRRSGNGMVGFGNSMLQGSRAIQDFQAAGLMGMINNVEGLATAMGLGGGVAGAATLAFVALQVLGPKLAEVFGSTAPKLFGDRLDELKDKLQTLEKKELKLTADYTAITEAKAEVEALTQAKQALDGLLGRQSKYEAASGKAISDLIVETPGAQEALAAAEKTAGERAAQGAPEVVTARAAVEAARVRAEDAQKATRGLGAGFEETQIALDAQAALNTAKIALEVAQNKARGLGEASVGNLIKTATQGQGRAQTDAQRDLAALFGHAGPAADELRAGILSNRPADIARREKAAADEKQAATAREKADAIARKAADEAAATAKNQENERRKDEAENEANFKRFQREKEAAEKTAAQAEARRIGGLAAPYEGDFARTVAGLGRAGATTGEITGAVGGQLRGALGPGGKPLSDADRAAVAAKITADMQAKIPETIKQINTRMDIADQTTAQLTQALGQMLKQSRTGMQRTRAINQFTQTIIRTQQLNGR